MKASEVIKIAKTANNKLLPSVYSVIKKAAQKGKFETFFYKELSPSEIKELGENGFTITQATDRDGFLCTIKWPIRVLDYPETPVETNH